MRKTEETDHRRPVTPAIANVPKNEINASEKIGVDLHATKATKQAISNPNSRQSAD